MSEPPTNTVVVTPLILAIREVEDAHFRTRHDTGSNEQAMTVLNAFRRLAQLPMLRSEDLPIFDESVRKYVVPQGSKLLRSLDPQTLEESVRRLFESKTLYVYRVVLLRQDPEDETRQNSYTEFYAAPDIEHVWEALKVERADERVEIEAVTREVPLLAVLQGTSD